MKKLFIFTASSVLLCNVIQAQNIAPRDNTLWDMNYYNPAVVMKPQGTFLDFYGRYDINPYKNYHTNPLDLSAEAYIVREDHSWETSLRYDALSYFDGAILDVSYAHNWKFGIFGEHRLRVGGRLALGYGRVDFSKLDYGDEGYKIMVRPDMDLGLEYQYKFFHIGFAVKNIMSFPFKYDDGIVYFRYPRAYLGHILFDINILDKAMLNPYLVLGMNQNVFLDLGLSTTLYRYYRLIYCFHVPELSHNIGVSVDICDLIRIEGGYCFSPAHGTSAVTVKLGVRLGK